jgi:hypothetical protein
MRIYIASERNRLIQKMLKAKKEGAKTQPAIQTRDAFVESESDGQ